MPAVAYDPNNPIQRQFLASLSLGEVGNASNALTLGVGGTDLTGAPTDQYGFPQWAGWAGSHAAGEFQFQPATWDAVAAAHGLNFSSATDQEAGAWYLAQDTYAQKTGGDLMTALQGGDLSSVQSALSSVWPSVTGNAANPGGLASAFSKGLGKLIPGFGGSASGDSADSGTAAGGIEGWFLRGGLIIVGVVVIVVALWKLLSDQGVLPSAGDVAKTVAAVGV